MGNAFDAASYQPTPEERTIFDRMVEASLVPEECEGFLPEEFVLSEAEQAVFDGSDYLLRNLYRFPWDAWGLIPPWDSRADRIESRRDRHFLTQLRAEQERRPQFYRRGSEADRFIDRL